MKKLYTLLGIALIGFVGKAQIVNIPDANFKAKLVTLGLDTNADGNIQQSEVSSIYSLDVSNSNISNLTGIEYFTLLNTLNCSNNAIQLLNLNSLAAHLADLNCSSNQLQSLDLSPFLLLWNLDCSNNQLTSLNVSGLIYLETLSCSSNQLTSLNVNGLSGLKDLACGLNHISSLSCHNLLQLEGLNCSNNQMTTLDLLNLPNLNILGCPNNLLTTLDLSNFTGLQILYCRDNILQTLNVQGLSSLMTLTCSNNHLTSLNLSGLSSLIGLYSDGNQLTSIDVSPLTSVHVLEVSSNLLTSIDITSIPNLQQFFCLYNQLTSLNLSGMTNLGWLNIKSNNISALDISNLPNLQSLTCSNNPIAALDLSNAIQLAGLYCSNTQLFTLDLSHSGQLGDLYCSDNPSLTTLFIKNGSNAEYLIFSNDPNLQYICADEAQVASIQTQITGYGYTNCHVNSYCSFVPGGTFYTIQGNSHYDSNNNGCDVSDINYPNLKLSFTDGTNTGNLIPDTTGAYYYDVQAGTQTFAPVLENSSYFTVSPTTATVTFPTTTSPFVQDFCLAANGLHTDLEVALLPIGSARPGFDATYKIIYKNKGTATQSGTVNLAFDDARLDFVSALPAVSSQATNSLNWSFSNLLPFEIREITVVLNVNSPTETPAVNAGDVLNYTATVTGVTDETPNDNSSTLNQTVINSFDPNDKTCIEGATVSPIMVGQYVHYVIRFENDGTANAQNIVVKDMIDTTKFDVSSLVPLSGSAVYSTRITNTNQVEFIFQNINLPFASGTNTGYVAFKIKTKPTLVVGDTFSNSANIYFDYNYPITTNTATTTIATLGIEDFDFGSVFIVSPVPAINSLTITTKQEVIMNSVSIYNTLGQLVQVNTNPNENIDVSGLESGSYFIRITSDKGSSTGKFIKE